MLAYQVLGHQSRTGLPPTNHATVSTMETEQKWHTTLTITENICHFFTTILKRCRQNGINLEDCWELFRLTQGQPNKLGESATASHW